LNAEKYKGSTFDVNNNVIPTPGAINTEQQGLNAQARIIQSKDFENEGQAFLPKSSQAMNNLTQLEDLYSKFKSGAETPSKANWDRVMGAVDPTGQRPWLHDYSAGNYDVAMKDAIAFQLQQLSGMARGAPATELNTLAGAIPSATMSPEGVHNIIGKAKANIGYQQQMYNGYDAESENYNPISYQKKFIAANPYDAYVKMVMSTMKPGAGMGPAQVNSIEDVAKLPSKTPFIIPSGPNKGKTGYAP